MSEPSKLINVVLSNPDLFPPDFKSWLISHINGDPNLQVSRDQLTVPTDGGADIGSLRTLGAGAAQAVAGNDSRLSNTRFPSNDASLLHKTGDEAKSGQLLLTGAAKASGYGTGAGGSVTQINSKSFPVTLNRPSGQIIMHNASLPAGQSVAFSLNNSVVDQFDGILVTVQATATIPSADSNYIVRANIGYNAGAYGLATIVVKNDTGLALAEALVLNFHVIKGANA